MEIKDGLLLLFSQPEEEPWYKEFLYGVEEEGIPLYCLDGREEASCGSDALSLANTAARFCCFELGIGADQDLLILRHRLQKNEAPLLWISRESGEEAAIRQLGHNAARIVKSAPLILDPGEEIFQQEAFKRDRL